MTVIPHIIKTFGSVTPQWTFVRVVECAEMCTTYREFCIRFMLPYLAARNHGWLQAIICHCGWDNTDRDSEWTTENIQELLDSDGSLISQAYEDSNWPMDVTVENSWRHPFKYGSNV